MKKSVRELGKCLLNLDICSNIDDTLEAFVNYMDDIRFDKMGLKIWVKTNPINNGERLTNLLWLRMKGGNEINEWVTKSKQDISDTKRLQEANAYLYDIKFGTYFKILEEIQSLKNKKSTMIKNLKCLSYENLQNLDFWKEYLLFTSNIKKEDIEDTASDLMIYVTFVSNKTSKLLMEFLRKLEIEDEFINHIKRYSDVIRYHRGLFIKSLKSITTNTVSKEEATRITENLIKYSHCNIPVPGKIKSFSTVNVRVSAPEKVNYPLTIDEIIAYIMGNNFEEILPFIIKSITWKLNCSGKEIDTDNFEFNNQVKNNQQSKISRQSSEKTPSESDKSNNSENIADILNDINVSKTLEQNRESVKPIVTIKTIYEEKFNLDKLEQELKSN